MTIIIQCDKCKYQENPRSWPISVKRTFREEPGPFGFKRHICSQCDENTMNERTNKLLNRYLTKK